MANRPPLKAELNTTRDQNVAASTALPTQMLNASPTGNLAAQKMGPNTAGKHYLVRGPIIVMDDPH